MKKETKVVIATALRNIATAIENEPESMFGHFFEVPETKSTVVQDKSNEDLLNDYFHETVGKSGRTLNHSLNKVRKDWEMKSLRTPKGPRALVEVAVDCKIDPKELCQMIQLHPRFSQNEIGAAADALLEQLK